MAKNKKIIMAWSKCKIDLAPMPEDESMAEDSAMVAEEKQEGTFELTTEIIEPSDDLYVNLGIAHMSDEDLLVDTHIVPGNYSLKLTPKNLGAKGIKIPKCSISVAPAFGDDTGHALTITASVLQGEAGYWYSKFLHRGDLTLSKYKVDLANSDTSSSPSQTVEVTTDEDVISAVSNASWCVVKVSGTSVQIGAKANSGVERTASVTVTAGSYKGLITVKQAAAAG